MPRCPGCTEDFKKLPDNSCCGRCTGLDDLPKEQWALCRSCGKTYKFLAGSECGFCKDEDDDLNNAGINHAITHGVDVRSHSKPGHQYANSYQKQQIPGASGSRPSSLDEDLRTRAANIQANMGQGYGAALSWQSQSQSSKIIARPKMKGVSATAVTSSNGGASTIRVIVKLVTNRHNTDKITRHTASAMFYEEDTPWSSVEEDIRIDLDAVYVHDFDLCHYSSRTKVDENRTNGNIKYFWNHIMKQGKFLSSDKARGTRVIELVAIVDYPTYNTADEDFQNTSFSTRARKGKRKAQLPDSDDEEERPSKRPSKRPDHLPISGAGAYATIVNDIEEHSYTVDKTICRISGNGRVAYVTEGAPTLIYVEKEKFSSGITKNAFKMTFDDALSEYAAKCFYRGQDPAADISSAMNLRLLKEELLCQVLGKKCLQKFQSEVAARKANAFDLTMNDSFILTVADGAEKGLAWIVDPLLPSTSVRKFSGTMQAGNNSADLLGRTCDAFAHFSLTDSQGTFVLIDIQGIIVPLMRNGRQTQAKVFTMFDLMAHSADKSKGMGDRGMAGIRDFASQHNCNDICRELGLPDPTVNLDTADTEQRGSGESAKETSSEKDDDKDDNDDLYGQYAPQPLHHDDVDALNLPNTGSGNKEVPRGEGVPAQSNILK